MFLMLQNANGFSSVSNSIEQYLLPLCRQEKNFHTVLRNFLLWRVLPFLQTRFVRVLCDTLTFYFALKMLNL